MAEPEDLDYKELEEELRKLERTAPKGKFTLLMGCDENGYSQCGVFDSLDEAVDKMKEWQLGAIPYAERHAHAEGKELDHRTLISMLKNPRLACEYIGLKSKIFNDQGVEVTPDH